MVSTEPSTHVDALFHHLRHSPERVAFRLDGREMRFGELAERARRYAAGLRELGVGHGDRVACLLPTSLEMVVALVGAYWIGAIHVPINTRYREAEIDHILRDSEASFLVCPATGEHRELLDAMALPESLQGRILVPTGEDDGDGEGEAELRCGDVDFGALLEQPALDEAPACADEDVALIIYTSGTTGRSKGVMLPHRAVVADIDALTGLWRWTPRDVLLLALPLFHVHGLCIGVHGVLIRGCEAVLHASFDAERVAEAMGPDGEAGATIFMGVPTMYAKIVEAFGRDPGLAEPMGGARLYTSGSAALSVNVFRAFEKATGHRILERYGMSETLLTLSNPYEPAENRRAGTVGKPVPGCEVRVVDEQGEEVAPGEVGQIVVRGASLMKGYWRQPEKTAESFVDGWFQTGDVAQVDAEGHVAIVGRASVDIIKSGGYKISAREIEEVLERHPSVREIAIFGVPDDVWGERITAAVVPSEPVEAVDPDALQAELAAYGREHLADYKQVREVRVLEAIPRNALGKVQKHRLQE